MEKHEENEELEQETPLSDTDTEVQKLIQERDELQDRLLRRQAEFENFKKRAERERSEFVQFASADLMRELLNVLDSFDSGIQNARVEGASAEDVLHGMVLIQKQFADALSRFGLKAIEAKGQPFDPNLHQAISTVPTKEVEENTVVEEMRRGYTLNGRLLRPAMVSVAVKAGQEAGD
jgi:molecular chaperone GrpE